MGTDPTILAAALYLAAVFVSDRMLAPARRALSAEEKVRLVDAGAKLRSTAYLPSALALLVLGFGFGLWPQHIGRVVLATYVAFAGATFVVTVYSWRRIRALEIRDHYLRTWALSRAIYVIAAICLCGYVAHYYVVVGSPTT